MIIDLLRRLGGTRLLLPTTALLLRGRCVTRPFMFVAREALGRRGTFLYRLRDGGRPVMLRHGTGDVVTLGEVFHNLDYAPPPELQRPDTIVDIGANIGLFGVYARTRWPLAKIVGYEPDPVNAAVQLATIARQPEGNWELNSAAAGNTHGTLRFAFGLDALSHGLDPGEQAGQVLEVPLVDVLDEVGAADLVKLDIEGGEWAIVSDPRFAARPPRALVMEYHPRGCPGPDAHTEIRRFIEAAGMTHRTIWQAPEGHGMLWAWRS